MRILLDTHSFLWFINGDLQLSGTARSHMEDETTDLFLSMASLWEIAIKMSLGKLQLAQPYDIFIPQQLTLNEIFLLNITITHTSSVVSLPFHHRDPFDRLIIAQSSVEQMPVISKDDVFDTYGIKRIW